ncbi:MAG: hypothetical protein LKI42_00760 [Bacteroidales bacterium]|jgi:hypothetical protein|nr:hypothetical protein [Bacteroidales bacterium]MCI1784713.1 hypothetical protein [Bacteroidales bacterium]
MEKMKFLKSAAAMMLCCVSATIMISCKKDDKPASALKFNPAKVEAIVGSTVSVTVSGGTEPYTVVSSDAKTATVTVTKDVIKVTGIKDGTATITVTDKDKLSSKVPVTVKTATGLTFDKNPVNVAVGKEDVVTINGGVAPYVVAAKDATIATAIEKDGKITVKGVKAGTTTISVTDKNKKSGTVIVTVK